MLVFVVGQVPFALRFAHARQAVRGGELRHDQPAARLLIGHARFNPIGKIGRRAFRSSALMEQTRIANESAKHRVRHARHRRQYRRRRNRNGADLQRRGNANPLGHRVLCRIVPMLFHCLRLILDATTKRPPPRRRPQCSSNARAVTSRLSRPWPSPTAHTCGGSAPRDRRYQSSSACR